MDDVERQISSSSTGSINELHSPLLGYQKQPKGPLLRRIKEAPKRLGRAVKAKADLFNLTSHYRTKWLSSLGVSLRDYLLYDPDMPECANKTMKRSFEKFWADCEHEFERTIEACLIEYENDANKPGPTGEGFYGIYCAIRAVVLHHYFPYNRTMWGKYQDPVYLSIFVLTLIPIHGLRCCVFLVIFSFQCYPGPSDEYQMVNYILNFKGLQFFSSGFVAMVIGVTSYYSCYSYHRNEVLECIDTRGPGANETVGQIFDYLGNVGLVWLAYLELPNSITVPLQANSEVKRADFVSRSKAAAERLKSLMCYDLCAFTLSFTLFLYLSFTTGGFYSLLQTQENIYWSSVFYSLSALPFSFFYFPIVQYLLIHRDATGFNEYGACVTFALPTPPEDENEAEDAEEQEDESVSGGTAALEHVNRFLRWADIGRKKRGGQEGEYSFGDITRGARTRLKHRLLGDKEHNLVGLGKKFRAGDTDVKYEFGDISRGIGWKLKTMGMSAAIAESNDFQDNRPLYIVPGSLRIPEVTPLPDTKNKHVYTVVCFFAAETELADGEWEDQKKDDEWKVLRRYSEFRNLMARLGPRCLSYTDAPFPRRHTFSMSPQKIEARRQGLESWLRNVVEDPKANESPWAGYLRAFLDTHWEDTTCSTFLSIASSSSNTYASMDDFSDSGGEESGKRSPLPRLAEEDEDMYIEEGDVDARTGMRVSQFLKDTDAPNADEAECQFYNIGSFRPEKERNSLVRDERNSSIRDGGNSARRRGGIRESMVPPEFFQMASFVHSDGSEDEVEQDMFGGDIDEETWSPQIQYTEDYLCKIRDMLGRETKQHDVIKISTGEWMTLEEFTEKNGGAGLRDAFPIYVKRQAALEDFSSRVFHISRGIFDSDEPDAVEK